jgi:transcriptional regulator with XRE-family HTH domain
MAKKKPDPIDVHVAANIRLFRSAKGLSQTTLGDILRVTFQQVQKYEKGLNRVGSSRLSILSKTLGIPINRFFEDHDEIDGGGTSKVVADLLSQQFSMRMLRAFARVRPVRKRLALIHLIEALTNATARPGQIGFLF